MRIILLTVLFLSSTLFAGNGTLKGKITDRDTGEPLAGVNILIERTLLGGSTDINGNYLIKKIPAATYAVKAIYLGYQDVTIINVVIVSDSITILDMHLNPRAVETDEIVVTATKPIIKKDITHSRCIIISEDIQNQPVRGVPNMQALQGGVVGKDRNRNTRDGRSSEMAYYLDGVPGNFNTEEYDRIVENDPKETLRNPLSTFSIDVDGASYSNVRRFIREGRRPPKDAIRIEEFINYFNYDYKEPEAENPFSINLEYGPCPWDEEKKLAHIGLKGKMLKEDELKPSNIVFLIDVSGSMNNDKKLPLLKKAYKLFVKQLKDEDKVAIVVYAGNAGLVLPSTKGNNKKRIIAAIDKLQAGGSTAGGQGIKLAYEIAEDNFIEDGNNRIVWATDGDFNVGVSSTSALVEFVEDKRDDGIFLTMLGFGGGNLKDSRMEQIADHGNGNYYYIDTFLEAQKTLVNEIGSTLYTIAKDVKIQVEFNPAKVKSYRLVGYENRLLNNEDFEDDKKDAGEIGAGHTVTAIYEIVENSDDEDDTLDYKYLETKVKDSANFSNEILTIRLRYKKPDEDESILLSEILTEFEDDLEKTTDNFRFSAAVAEFAFLLRDSEYRGSANIDHVKELARNSMGEDTFGYRGEFLRIVSATYSLISQ